MVNPSKKVVIGVAILFVVSLFALISFFPEWTETEPFLLKKDKSVELSHESKELNHEPKVAVFDKDPSSEVSQASLQEKFIEVNGVKIFTLSSSETASSSPVVLLLHGQAFSSKTWKDLGTLDSLQQSGFNPIAVDLPGFGKSGKTTEDVSPGEFLNHLIKALQVNKPAIVSPSMSGRFTIPYLLKHADQVRGFIPVAPVIDPQLTKGDFAKISVPTLSIYGELDRGAIAKNQILSGIKDMKVEKIVGGKHPCYLDDPVRFHKLLNDFISGLP